MSWFRWFDDCPPGTLEHNDPLEDLPDEKAGAIVESIARKIVDKGLAVPAMMALEVSRPISFILSQGVIFSGAVASPFMGQSRINAASAFLQKRSNITRLLDRVEELHDEDLAQRKAGKA